MLVAHLFLTYFKVMPNRASQLAKEVFACLAGDRLVFLDLPTNKYLCLNAENSRIALQISSLPGIAQPSQPMTGMDSQSKGLLIMQALMNRRLITRAPGAEGIAGLCRPPRAAGREINLSQFAPARARLSHWRAFLIGAASASAKLRCWSMLKIVQSIRQRKGRANNRVKLNETELAMTVAVFNRLRPFYPRAYLCLYDSLALLEFLSRQGCYPLWVFGVKSDPFGAHCWVQWHDLVLNDAAARVHRYTPIMIV
ncbi:MAG: lasso peptide biosynthesis B2 protein [Pseudomonadales bacterium]